MCECRWRDSLPLSDCSELLGLDTFSFAVDRIQIALPPPDCFTQQVALVATFEGAGVHGVMNLGGPLSSNKDRGALPGANLVCVNDVVPFRIDEAPKNSRFRLRAFELTPCSVDGT